MAGGQNNRLHNSSIARRLASKEGAAPDPVVYPRHCWVVGLPGAPERLAGLLISWEQQSPGGWVGRVVFAHAADDGTGLVLVERWVREEFLEPP